MQSTHTHYYSDFQFSNSHTLLFSAAYNTISISINIIQRSQRTYYKYYQSFSDSQLSYSVFFSHPDKRAAISICLCILLGSKLLMGNDHWGRPHEEWPHEEWTPSEGWPHEVGFSRSHWCTLLRVNLLRVVLLWFNLPESVSSWGGSSWRETRLPSFPHGRFPHGRFPYGYLLFLMKTRDFKLHDRSSKSTKSI